MTRFSRYAVVSILSLVVGFIVCREIQKSDGSKGASGQSDSTFEADALGFVNWYRLMGRDAISHQELTRNLQILESKAIKSGKLISSHKPGETAEQEAAPSNGDKPSN